MNKLLIITGIALILGLGTAYAFEIIELVPIAILQNHFTNDSLHVHSIRIANDEGENFGFVMYDGNNAVKMMDNGDVIINDEWRCNDKCKKVR